MCGIAGFIEHPRLASDSGIAPQERLVAMMNRIKHRGPDDWGLAMAGFGVPSGDPAHAMHFDAGSARVALSQLRLSILDISPAGRQPMYFPASDSWIVFNGEVYNYVELREKLKHKYDFHTSSDTEVMLAAFAEWGPEAVKLFQGMFAIALWDNRRKQLFCARDPVGIKPFYYATVDGRFYFGSEPRAVIAGIGTSGHIDERHVAEYLALAISDHDEGSFYREVKQLRGGHWMIVNAEGEVGEPVRFWQPTTNILPDDSPVPELLQETFLTSVNMHLRSDVPVGGCLSGGIDSGAIAITVGDILKDRSNLFNCLTISYESKRKDETGLAQLTAKRAGLNWIRAHQDTRAVADNIYRLMHSYGEPFNGLSELGQFRVMEAAKEAGLTVMLDGQGGDEVFVGYPRVVQRVVADYLKAGKIGKAWHETMCIHRNLSIGFPHLTVGQLYFQSPKLVWWRNLKRVRPYMNSNLLSAISEQTLHDAYLPGSLREIQRMELTKTILPRLLRSEDRNSMAFAIEARVPILSTPVIDLALQFPTHWQVRDGWTKYSMRTVMKGRLPDEVLWNTVKYGFNVPQAEWMQQASGKIKEWLGEITRPLPVDKAVLIRDLDTPMCGTKHFWRALSVALWMHFFDVSV